MKKFFSVIPLQPEGNLKMAHYRPEGNSRLELGRETRFPILCVINGYAEPEEEIRVIVTVVENEDSRRNLKLFEKELETLQKEKGFRCQELEILRVPTDDKVSTHVETFQRLIDLVDDDDELFACMTYGSKPLSTAEMMAVEYALRVKKNASVTCVVYGQMDRSVQPAIPTVYDMTALVQMDEIVHLLSKNGDPDPKKTIDRLLAL